MGRVHVQRQDRNGARRTPRPKTGGRGVGTAIATDRPHELPLELRPPSRCGVCPCRTLGECVLAAAREVKCRNRGQPVRCPTYSQRNSPFLLVLPSQSRGRPRDYLGQGDAKEPTGGPTRTGHPFGMDLPNAAVSSERRDDREGRDQNVPSWRFHVMCFSGIAPIRTLSKVAPFQR